MNLKCPNKQFKDISLLFQTEAVNNTVALEVNILCYNLIFLSLAIILKSIYTPKILHQYQTEWESVLNPRMLQCSYIVQ